MTKESDSSGEQLEQAHACYQSRQFAEAENLCRVILEREPDNGPALQLLGSIARVMGFAREAVPILVRACELSPGNTGMLRDLARCQRQAGDPVAAMQTLHRWLEAEPDSAQAWADLGTVQTEAGDLEAARQSLREAVRRVPGFGDAWNALARLKHFAAGDPDLARLERELARPGIASKEIVSFNYALGKAREDLGDYHRAMTHYRAGAAEQRRSLSYDPDAFSRAVQSIIDAFPALPAVSGDAPLPAPVFLVGMPRSGSTLVEQIISRHPETASAGELTAFPAVVVQLDRLLADRGGYPAGVAELGADELAQMADAYREQLRRVAREGRVVTDKMLLNYLHCGLIAAVLPSARFVHCVRDPLDTCFSCYSTVFGAGQEYSKDLTELGRHYVAYRRLMAHWSRLLGDRLMELSYEQLVQQPEPTVRELLAFLGLDWDPVCLEFSSATRTVRTASAAQVRRSLYSTSVGRGHRFREHLGPLINELKALHEDSG